MRITSDMVPGKTPTRKETFLMDVLKTGTSFTAESFTVTMISTSENTRMIQRTVKGSLLDSMMVRSSMESG
jgi:hypothetical protein